MSEEAPRKGTKVDYDALFKAIGKREVSKPELLDWVFDHVGVHPNEIPMDDWPCYGAIRLLVQANADYNGFLQLWSKLIPNQTQLKLQERTKDEGQALPLLDALEKEFADQSAKESTEKPSLPA